MKILARLVPAGLLLVAACDGGNMNGGTGGGSGGGAGGAGGGAAGGTSAAHLSGLPDCGTPADAGTIDDFYDRLIVNSGCSAGGCHGPGSPFFMFQFSDAGTLKTAWIDAGSSQVAMKRITPGNIDQSYVLYKLWGQHLDAGVRGSGDRMPQGGPYLRPDEMCTVINWVNAGAP